MIVAAYIWMKLGVGLQRGRVHDRDFLRFLRQIGVTHVILFMPDEHVLPSAKDGYWSYGYVSEVVRHLDSNGLTVDGIENFMPAHWDKILLDLPGKEKQLDNLKRTVAAIGKAKIPTMGYNFSLGGVIGRELAPLARAGARVAAYDRKRFPYDDSPLPHGMAWGRVVDPDAPAGTIGEVSREEVWQRLCWFLEQMLPVAESCGVRLAAHPEDPPLPMMRSAGRVLINPEAFDRLFARFPSQACAVEFCQGTFSEMPGVNVYDAIAHFAAQQRIAYVHFRNVRGKLPSYSEVFIDEGDVDMARALQTYHKEGYDGCIIPDHLPGLAGVKTEHASLAYAIAYMRGLMDALGIPVFSRE